jgi:hypothetical protein
MIRRLAFLPLLVVLLPAQGEAQSLLSAFGLGIPGAPLDARSRALGVAGTGLPGWHILSNDVASVGGVSLPSMSVTLQSSATDFGGGRVFGQTRFPQIGLSYPYGWNVFFLEMGTYLGQEWSSARSGFLSVGGVAVGSTDTFTSTGGIGRVQVGWSRRLLESLSVGVSAGRYLGSLNRTFDRVIDGTSIGQGVESYSTSGRWRASGVVAGAGVVYDPSPLLRLSAGVTWSDDLTLTPVEGTPSGAVYAMPLELRGGGTFTLTPGVSVVLGASYSDWSDTRADLSQEVAGEGASLSYGGGVEISSFSLLGKAIPIRVGARHVDLPFGPEGGGSSERTLSGGLGIHLVEGPEFPRARVDFGLEKGTRTGIVDPEAFWRLSISLSIAGS